MASAYPLPARARESQVVLRSLVVFNAVFAVETIVDIVYLWGGAELPAGLTYAAFAHRAAYPLIASALLAAAFVLLTFRANGPGHASRPVRILVYIWLAQNAFLVLSCLTRLKMYVDAYSLTRWRIAAIIWTGLVLLGLLLIVIKLARRRSNIWLLRANLAALLITLYVCSFVNWERMIAAFNVRHCAEIDNTGVPLDLAYLEKLGPAALPALLSVRDSLPPEKQVEATRIAGDLHQRLRLQMNDWVVKSPR